MERLLPFGQWVYDKSRDSCDSSDSCSKKNPSAFYPCAKNIRAIRAIRVQKKQSAQVPHTNAEPRRTTFILFNICHISFTYEKRTVLFQNLLTVLYYHSGMSASTYGTTGNVIFLAVHSLRCTYRRYAGLHVIGNLAILKYKRTILIT